MASISVLALLLFCAYGSFHKASGTGTSEEDAKDWLDSIEVELGNRCYHTVDSKWSYSVDMTDAKKNVSLLTGIAYSKYKKSLWKKAKKFPRKTYKNETLKRILKYMSNIATEALDDKDVEKFEAVVQNMTTIYGTAKVCKYKDSSKCDLALSPEIEDIFATSRDYDELVYYWKAWRDAAGKPIANQYTQYVEFNQKAAKLNGFNDTYEMWLDNYETPHFEKEIFDLWEEVKPLYLQLHAYIRRHLIKEFPGKINKNGLLPAHLFGDMWAQNWATLLDKTIPFKGKSAIDVTDAMVEKGYTPEKMYQLGDDFFQSLGYEPLGKEFWSGSVLRKPADREITCHPSAWDFCNSKDFRIRMCTQVTQKDLVTVHHELGHVFYYMAYKNQAQYFRDAANDGFHEALGDTIAYSVASPKHLKKIGLLEDFEDSYEYDINFLYNQALAKIAFLPFSLAVEKWRWDTFQFKIKPEEYNCQWWKYRRQFQGLKPACPRTSTDFDPGAKYHIPSSTPYLRYFIAAISELMFHKSACIAANEYDPEDPKKPLHKCDIFESKAAGAKLDGMLKLGSSVSWREALRVSTGETKLNASALLEYFKPVYEWLKKENEQTGEKIGWVDDGEALCVKDDGTSSMNQNVLKVHSLFAEKGKSIDSTRN